MKLHPLPLKDHGDKKSPYKGPGEKERDMKGKNSKSKGIHILGAVEFERELQENLENGKAGESAMFVLVTKEVTNEKAVEILEVEQVLHEFQDVFPKELPNELPP